MTAARAEYDPKLWPEFPMSEAQRVAIPAEQLDALAHREAYFGLLAFIESHCLYKGESESSDSIAEWWELPDEKDVDNAYVVAEALKYLDARGLVERHPHMPNWIALRDESEASR